VMQGRPDVAPTVPAPGGQPQPARPVLPPVPPPQTPTPPGQAPPR
jgi:hypothetical protein